MIGEQLDILRHAQKALKQGQKTILITVIKTWGSSPRPLGSMLSLCEDGSFCGSVSGGCVEDNMIEQLLTDFPSQIQVVIYGETEDERRRYKLPCGGTLKLLIHPIEDSRELEPLIEALQQRSVIKHTVNINDGSTLTETADRTETSLTPSLTQDENGTPIQWTNIIGPMWRIFVVGAGSISQYLGEMATALGYQVIVCDPRPEYRAQWNPAHGQLVDGYPDDALMALQPDARTAIVGLTHDPKLDDLAVIQGLQSPVFYLGAMGSTNTSNNRRARLMEHFGFSEQDLKELKAPIGLDIGSKTPPEIALSTLAEITAAKNGKISYCS